MKTGKVSARFKGHDYLITHMDFSPDGKTLASLSRGRESKESAGWRAEVKLWEVETSKCLHTLKGHPISLFCCLAFSSDGKAVAAGGAATELQPRKPSKSWGEVRVWDVATGKERAKLKHDDCPRDVYAVAFSPDGKTLASGYQEYTPQRAEGVIKLWDLETAKEQVTLRGHPGAVNALAFSPDGRLLASGCFGSTLKLWDLSPGKETNK